MLHHSGSNMLDTVSNVVDLLFNLDDFICLYFLLERTDQVV